MASYVAMNWPDCEISMSGYADEKLASYYACVEGDSGSS